MRTNLTALLSALALLGACKPAPPRTPGTTITNVSIVDGTGAPSLRGQVRLVSDSISAVGDSVAAVRSRDCDG